MVTTPSAVVTSDSNTVYSRDYTYGSVPSTKLSENRLQVGTRFPTALTFLDDTPKILTSLADDKSHLGPSSGGPLVPCLDSTRPLPLSLLSILSVTPTQDTEPWVVTVVSGPVSKLGRVRVGVGVGVVDTQTTFYGTIQNPVHPGSSPKRGRSPVTSETHSSPVVQ